MISAPKLCEPLATEYVAGYAARRGYDSISGNHT